MFVVRFSLLFCPSCFDVVLQGAICLAKLRASLARHIYNSYLHQSAVDKGMNDFEESTYGMVSEWKKGDRPILPWNKDGKFMRVYVSRTGIVLCYAEINRAERDRALKRFLIINSDNPYFEWAASFDRDICENWKE